MAAGARRTGAPVPLRQVQGDAPTPASDREARLRRRRGVPCPRGASQQTTKSSLLASFVGDASRSQCGAPDSSAASTQRNGSDWHVRLPLRPAGTGYPYLRDSGRNLRVLLINPQNGAAAGVLAGKPAAALEERRQPESAGSRRGRRTSSRTRTRGWAAFLRGVLEASRLPRTGGEAVRAVGLRRRRDAAGSRCRPRSPSG